jgi:hypothetical protein
MRKSKEGGSTIWFLGPLVMELLEIGGLEINLGLPVEKVRINQILLHVENQETDIKVIKDLLKTHQQEVSKMK